MLKQIYIWFIIFNCTILPINIFATHIVGGEIFYTCIGEDISKPGFYNYQLELKIYRECNDPSNALLDNPAFISLFDQFNVRIDTFHLYLDSINNIPAYIDNPCLITPPNICVEAGHYSRIISIPGGQGDFTVTSQRCCRNNTIVNLVNSGFTGSTYTVEIKDPLNYNCNSSPRFVDFPPLAICSNFPIAFNHYATDPDNDSLVYEFCTPLDGGTAGDPKPVPTSPPYSEVSWNTGFGAPNALTCNPPITLSPYGMIDGVPRAMGQYVVGVCVSEYRNGELLTKAFRDFQFNVVDCNPNIVSAIQEQMVFCNGLKYKMVNKTIGAAQNYKWDFGVEGALGDTSRMISPTFTFPDTGKYLVTLIANPDWPCADTTTEIYDVKDSLNIYFDKPTAQCLKGNEFSFIIKGSFNSSANIVWKFDSAISNASTQLAPTVSYPKAGIFPVKLFVQQDGCEDVHRESVEVVENPISDFSFDIDTGCVPLAINFQENSKFAEAPTYTWDMGDGNTRTGSNFTYIYEKPGNYYVSLLLENNGKCKVPDTKKHDGFTALPLPISSFTTDKTQASKFEAKIEFLDASLQSIKVEYFPYTGIKLDGPNAMFNFPDTGYYSIMQVCYNEFGCSDTSFNRIYIYDEYHIYIPNAFTPNDDGMNDIYKPVVSGTKKYIFQIFNRWGEMLFETSLVNEGWDGTVGDRHSPLGNYIYNVQTVDKLGNKESKTGSFQLIR